MLDRIRRDRQDSCEHKSIVTTRNHGLERQVCEACGRVSMKLLDRRAATEELIGTVHQDR